MTAFSKQRTINPIVDFKEKSIPVSKGEKRLDNNYHDCHHEHIYAVKEVLKEGWLLKKGSGNDWINSRAWKSRWARLVLAAVKGHEVNLPILEIYWHPTSPSQSGSIMLDSSVIVPMNRLEENKEHKNNKTFVKSFCFDIVSTVTSETTKSSRKVSRSFALNDSSLRDAWVGALMKAIVEHGKKENSIRLRRAKSPSTKRRINSLLPPISPPTSPSSRSRITSGQLSSSCLLPRPNEEHLAPALPLNF